MTNHRHPQSFSALTLLEGLITSVNIPPPCKMTVNLSSWTLNLTRQLLKTARNVEIWSFFFRLDQDVGNVLLSVCSLCHLWYLVRLCCLYRWWPVSDSLRPIHTTLLLNWVHSLCLLDSIQKKCGVNWAKAVTYGPPYVSRLRFVLKLVTFTFAFSLPPIVCHRSRT